MPWTEAIAVRVEDEHRGVRITSNLIGFVWTIHLPGTVLHHFNGGRGAVETLIDWMLDTGGDRNRLPPGYKGIGPATVESPAPAPKPRPAEPALPAPRRRRRAA